MLSNQYCVPKCDNKGGHTFPRDENVKKAVDIVNHRRLCVKESGREFILGDHQAAASYVQSTSPMMTTSKKQPIVNK